MVGHIVHLEDDLHLFNIFRVALQAVKPDLKIVQFTDAEQLLKYVLRAKNPIDVVILDIRVPGSLNGIQVAQQIRKMQYPVNIIITSAYSAPERRVLSEIDAHFIPKPWNIPAMISQILHQDVLGKTTEKRSQSASHSMADMAVPFILQDKSVQRMNSVLELLQSALRVEAGAILIGEALDAKIQNVIAFPSEWNSGKVRLFMETFATQIIQQRKPLFVDDVRPYISHETRLQNVISYAGIPFTLSDTRYCGVLCAVDGKVRRWKENDYDILCKLADLVQDTLETDNFVNILVTRNDALHSYSSTIAHDLKAPLGAIIGYADVIKLLARDILPENVFHYLNSITDSASIMSDMITRLLWLAKLDHPLAATSTVAVEQVVDAALARLQYQLDRRGVTVRLPSEFPSITGHDAWVEEVFANLISNAIKYMGDDNPNPTIEIRSVIEGQMARFEVRDNGIGISSEDQAKLFASFSRLHKVSVEGLGLGLVIVQRIVTNLKGQVGVESEAGKGSTFWFTLPLSLK
jgi:nitrogen-specific signal transduction histidine kinase/DNA-binding NarL/FixJ family response regulator